MNLVGIETATTACAVGVRTSQGVEATLVADTERRHNEVLAVTIAALLERCALKVRDVDRVVVDRGPGLFTGLRVGVATAIGLSRALGCELVSVTSLELLAHGAHDAGVRGTLVACVDARRGEIFVQTFELGDEVLVARPPEVATARDVVIEWATNGAPVIFSGDGVTRYHADFAAVANAALYSQDVPSMHAALALGSHRAPESVVTPLYLRDADAVANFATRERS